MKRLWLVIAVLQLAACASEADYRESVEQWIGAREADLVASSWGPPDRVYEVIGSGRILTYSKTSKTQAAPSIWPKIMIGSSGSGRIFPRTSTYPPIADVSDRRSECLRLTQSRYSQPRNSFAKLCGEAAA